MIHFDYGLTGTRRVLTRSNEELQVRPLQSNEEYIAISHTWGVTHNTVQGIGWEVASWISYQTCNALVEAFKNIWIDSLCIKQDDDNDKEEQIKDMGNIYRDAKETVVLLIGDFKAHLSALRCATELLINLGRKGECTKSRDCPYVRTLEQMRDAIITVRAMPWFRRVWTLQEAIIPESLRFVGFEGNILQTNVTTVNELQNFTKTFDEISDVTSAFHDRSKFASNPWLASSIHPCTTTTIDPFSVAKNVSDVVNSIKPTNLQWYKEMSGQDAVITLRYTVETVFRQLGSNNRECTNLNDLIYGVCAVLELEIEVDYKRRFEDVFFEALKQLVKRGLCVLPKRPQIGHGETWLPSLEHIDQRDAWRTVKSRDMYHNLVCKGTGIFANGRLIQMHHPNVFRTSLGGLASMLEDIVLSMHREDELHLDSIDPSLLAITSVALWMFRNHGSDHNVTTSGVESLICSVCNDAHSQIIQEIRLSAPVVVRVMGHDS